MKTLDAHIMALALMREHGLSERESGWTFRLGRAVKQFGSCNYTHKRITLSAPLTLLNDEAEVRDTILHEIAHALVGNKAGHGIVWQRKAKEIGCNGERTHNAAIPPAPLQMRCVHCGYKSFRSRRPARLNACPTCCNEHNGGKWSMTYVLVCEANPEYAGALR